MNLTRETITPTDESHWLGLRVNDLTSTDVASLFNLSPYKTNFELYWEKKQGERVQLADNERMLWGRRLQDAIAQGIAEDHGLIVRPMLEYVRIPDMRIGSSFDWAIEGVREGSPFARTFELYGPGILEIKNVDWLAFRNGWVVDDGFIEAPPHIEIQTQHQQLVADRRWSIIGALVGGNRYELLERLADDAVHAGIIARAAEFWRSIDENNPPDPVMPDDAEAVIRLNSFAEPGKLIDLRGEPDIADMLHQYHELGNAAKRIDDDRKVLKADLLIRIGDAEKVLTSAGKISAGIVGPAEVSYTREGYRNFRFYPAKVAQEG
jgi:predicted phage-related endonuclease